MPVRPSRPGRGRRPLQTRGAVLVVASVVASLLTVLGTPGAARAATVATGPLAAGTATTLTFAEADDALYDIEIPAGTTPTVRMTAMTPGASVLVGISGPQTQGGFFMDADTPSTWYAEYGPATTDASTATLSLQAFRAGTVTFTLGFATDRTVPVTPGQDVELTFAEPGDRALLTFPARGGDEVTATVVDSALSPVDPNITPLALSLQTQFGPQSLPFDGTVFGPGLTDADGTQTLVVDPAVDVTGTVTLHLEVTRALSGTLQYANAALPVLLDRPGLEQRYTLSARGGAPTLLQVFAPDLVHEDGTPGTATVELLTPGTAPRLLGTVTGSTPATFSTGTPLVPGDVVVQVVPDATTTGSLGLRATVDGGPAVDVPPAVATPFGLPAGAPARWLSVDLPAGAVEVSLRAVAYDPPDVPFPGARFVVVGPDGTLLGDGPVQAPAGFFALAVPVAGRYTFELVREQATAGTALTGEITIAPVVTSSTSRADLPVDRVVSTTLPGQQVEVVVRGRAGHRVVARLVDAQWTSTDPAESPTATAFVRMLDDAGAELSPLLAADYAETDVLAADTDVHVLVDPASLTVGRARLLVTEPVDATGTIGRGAATTVTVPEPGARAVYTVEGVAGRPLVLDFGAIDFTSAATGAGTFTDVVLRGPDGEAVAGPTSLPLEGTQWLESATPLDVSGTYTLTVDPFGDGVGSAAVTAVVPDVLTRAVRSGQTPTLVFGPGDQHRLTFAGRSGQRPVLQLPAQTPYWQGQALLLDPAGTQIGNRFVDANTRYVEFDALPANGGYTLVLDLFGPATATLTPTFTLAVDQTLRVPAERTTTVRWGPGRRTTVQIPVRKGEHFAVDVRALQLVGGSGFVDVRLLAPGSPSPVVQEFFGTGPGASSAPRWLEANALAVAPADGVWTLQILPDQGTTGSMTFVARTAKDLTQNVRPGRPATVQVEKPSATVRIPFTVTSADIGRSVQWSVSRSTFSPGVRLWVLSPSGFPDLLADVPARASGTGTSPWQLFEPGSYTLVVDPVDGSTGSARVSYSLTP